MSALDVIEGAATHKLMRLLERHGRSVTVRRVASGVYDAATGDVADAETTDFPTVGVFRINVNDGQERAATVETDDDNITIAAHWDGEDIPFVPRDGDFLIDGNYRVLRVLKARAFRYRNADIGYRLTVRE